MRISVVTLASRDPQRSAAFYRALLGVAERTDRCGVIHFPLDGTSLALYPREALARYCGVDAAGHGFAGVTLSVNLAGAAAVDAAAARATAAGATLVRAPGAASWGGYIAWVADPDGHLWELVFNPKAAR